MNSAAAVPRRASAGSSLSDVLFDSLVAQGRYLAEEAAQHRPSDNPAGQPRDVIQGVHGAARPAGFTHERTRDLLPRPHNELARLIHRACRLAMLLDRLHGRMSRRGRSHLVAYPRFHRVWRALRNAEFALLTHLAAVTS